jgi:hypothetical protein
MWNERDPCRIASLEAAQSAGDAKRLVGELIGMGHHLVEDPG